MGKLEHSLIRPGGRWSTPPPGPIPKHEISVVIEKTRRATVFDRTLDTFAAFQSIARTFHFEITAA
jgi:hypothetical protein